MELDLGPHRPLYGISVASELTGVNAPMLRAYESKGLIEPFRTDGGTRRYSEADLASVNRITTLLTAGLNLAGVQEVLRLEDETRELRAEVKGLQERLDRRSPEKHVTRPRWGGSGRRRTERSAGLAVLGVLAAARAELLQREAVGVVATVLLGDVVALLAVHAGKRDLGANVGALAGHGDVLQLSI